LPRHCGVQS